MLRAPTSLRASGYDEFLMLLSFETLGRMADGRAERQDSRLGPYQGPPRASIFCVCAIGKGAGRGGAGVT